MIKSRSLLTGFSATTTQPAAMAGQEEHRDGSSPRQVVLFSLPFQGHLNPMLKLAAVLHGRGLGVTVLHTVFNAPDPARHPELTFVPIHETLRDEATSPDSDILAKLLALNAACEAPFRQALASLLRRGGQDQDHDVACAVVDGQCYAALGAAGQLGVPVLAFRTDSAATFQNMLAYPRLRDAGYLPIKEEQLDEVVPDLEPLRVRDLIRVDGCDTDEICSFAARVVDAVRASVSGMVINTLEAMEASELAKIRRELSLPAFAIGPLHLLSSSSSRAPAEQSLYSPDLSCLAWLDAHPPRSVLYVSLGSLASVDRAVFEEMAWGLARSGVPFLWVVRPGLLTGGGGDEVPPLPDGFSEEVRSRGKIVTWAPQREVLAHAAIAAFWTHCGWNSILESVCQGVPMLVQPCFGDQMVNARYVAHEWGVGLEVGEVVERETVAKVVARVMVGEDGPLMREKARRLQMQACSATSSGMDGLVQYVLSL